jgi:hypothetical protein
VLAALGLGALVACSGQHVTVGPAPASPEATVGQFLVAVNANDHSRMAELFGDERGPSTVTIRNAARRDSVLTIMQHLLVTDSAHVVGSEPAAGNASRRLLRMDLFHGGERIAVPFTVAPQRAGGWLVAFIDIMPLMPSVNSRTRR